VGQIIPFALILDKGALALSARGAVGLPQSDLGRRDLKTFFLFIIDLKQGAAELECISLFIRNQYRMPPHARRQVLLGHIH